MNKYFDYKKWYILILIIISIWFLGVTIFDYGLDNYGDMVENYAWSQAPACGTFKHPPLISWIVHVWFYFVPTTEYYYYLLSWINVGFAFWGIAMLAKIYATKPELSHRDTLVQSGESVNKIQWTSVALASMMFPYSTLASKYNADTILLSLWPWATVFFLRSLVETNFKGFIYSILLAVLSTLSMLGKYYSGVLLLSFFFISILAPIGRQWYKTYKPYFVLLIFIILLYPHWLWLKNHNFVTFYYVQEAHGISGMHWRTTITFLLSYYLYAPVMWIVGYFYILKKSKQKMPLFQVFKDFFQTTLPQKTDNIIWLGLALFPMLITLFFGVINYVNLTIHWAIPIWFALPIYVISKKNNSIDETLIKDIWKIIIYIFVVMVVVRIGEDFLSNFSNKDKDCTYRNEMVSQCETNPRYQKVTWVGGIWQDAAAFAFYGKTHPLAVPYFPDTPQAKVNYISNWHEQKGILVCSEFFGKKEFQKCNNRVKSWLTAQKQSSKPFEYSVNSQAWWRLSSAPRKVSIFFYTSQSKKL